MRTGNAPHKGVRIVLRLLLGAMIALTPLPGGEALNPVDEAGYRKLLDAHRGKVVLANFWATWCEPCREEMPLLADLEKKLRGRGFVLLTISADEPEQEADALAFLRKSGVSAPAFIKRARSDDAFIGFVDPSWSGALPALFLYGRDGRKAAAFIGETESSDIETAIRKLL